MAIRIEIHSVNQPKATLPLYNHPLMTYQLKIGCRDVYRLNRLSYGREDRTLDMTCTSQMDPELLQACVSFLANDKFDYLSHVEKTPARKWYSPKTSAKSHNDAIMALRRHIAQDPHVAWDEDAVHFWSDFALLYHRLDATDQLQVDAFFELLTRTSFKALFKEHAVMSNTPFSPAESHPYQECLHLDALVRSDVAYHQFALTTGAEQRVALNDPDDENDFDAEQRWLDQYGPDDDYIERNYRPEFDHPELDDFTVSNPGQPFATLKDSILAAFDKQPQRGYSRHVSIKFRSSQVLSGNLTHDGFTPENIQPVQKLGMRIKRQDILDTLSDCQRSSHVRVKFDDMFGIDLGL